MTVDTESLGTSIVMGTKYINYACLVGKYCAQIAHALCSRPPPPPPPAGPHAWVP